MFPSFPALLDSLVVLTSCAAVTGPQASSAPASLAGYWKSGYGDGFQISGTSYTQYDDAARSVSFAGTIVNAPDLTASAGELTVRITNAGTWTKTVGKFYVVRWKALTAGGVQQSAASGWPNPTPEPATQADAESVFTVANGYFTMYGEYARQ